MALCFLSPLPALYADPDTNYPDPALDWNNFNAVDMRPRFLKSHLKHWPKWVALYDMERILRTPLNKDSVAWHTNTNYYINIQFVHLQTYIFYAVLDNKCVFLKPKVTIDQTRTIRNASIALDITIKLKQCNTLQKLYLLLYLWHVNNVFVLHINLLRTFIHINII